MSSGFCFLHSNVVIQPNDLPFSISDGLLLRPARENEVYLFKEHLSELGASASFIIPFDQEICEEKKVYVEQGAPRWWGVAFDGSNEEALHLGLAAALVVPKLHLGVTFYFSEKDQRGESTGKTFGVGSELSILREESQQSPGALCKDELEKLRSNHSVLTADTAVNSAELRIAKMYEATAGLAAQSELLTVALFAIIEATITHKPRSNETLDSIIHQLTNKIYLLSKRFDHLQEHSQFFGEIGARNLWKKLYELRSAIAHGGEYDFNRDKFQCLKSIQNVNEFLDGVTREVVKLSIVDGAFLADLKEC